MSKKPPVNLVDLIASAREESYDSVLTGYELSGDRYYRQLCKAKSEGMINDDEFEALLKIEKEKLNGLLSEINRGERGRLPHGTILNKHNNAVLVEIVLETLGEFEEIASDGNVVKVPAYQVADRTGKITHIRRNVINYINPDKNKPNGATRFFWNNGLCGVLGESRHLKKKHSSLALLELYDQVLRVGLFDRNRDVYLGRWEIQEKGMWQDKNGRTLAAEAVEDVLRWHIPEYRKASREEKIRLIREKVIGYKNPNKGKKNGPKQFFNDSGLGGMLNCSPYLRKADCSLAVLELYDQVLGLKLFDRAEEVYLGKWEVVEKGMFDGERGRVMLVDAVEDVLRWYVPGYKEADREGKVGLIKKYVIGYNSDDSTKPNGAKQFFIDHGLGGVLDKSLFLDTKSSVLSALKMYDQVRELRLFDTRYGSYLAETEMSRGWVLRQKRG